MTSTAPGTTDLDAARIANGIRRRVLAHVLANNGGYLSQACSSADLLATMYANVLRLAPTDGPMHPTAFESVPGPAAPRISGGTFHGEPGPNLDRFIISPAHYALVVYAALIEAGRLDEAALDQFNKDGSTVEMIGAEHSPGFETTTGSLAQALSTAGGIALGRRLKGDTGRTFVFMSDGEFQEGQTWEAVQALAYYNLDSVRVIVDVNRAQCDGPMDSVMNIEPLATKLKAFGASADSVDGHDIAALTHALERPTARPHFVLAYTDPVRGVPLMNNRRPVLHYLRFTGNDERQEYERFYEELVSSEIAGGAL